MLVQVPSRGRGVGLPGFKIFQFIVTAPEDSTLGQCPFPPSFQPPGPSPAAEPCGASSPSLYRCRRPASKMSYCCTAPLAQRPQQRRRQRWGTATCGQARPERRLQAVEAPAAAGLLPGRGRSSRPPRGCRAWRKVWAAHRMRWVPLGADARAVNAQPPGAGVQAGRWHCIAPSSRWGDMHCLCGPASEPFPYQSPTGL